MTTYPLIFRFVANRLRDMSKIVLMLVFVSVALLGCGGGGGGGADPVVQTFSTGTPTMAERTGDERNDVFTITGDITSDEFTLGVIDGAGGSDTVQLNEGAIVASIAFSDTAPTGGALHLQDIETITISGGTVGSIASGSDALTFNMMSGRVTGGVEGGAGADTFNLNGGRIDGNVNGGGGDDRFIIGSGFTFFGMIDGGGGTDTLSLSGFTPASANLFNNILTLTLSGGGELTFTLANFETYDIAGLTMDDLSGGGIGNGNGMMMPTPLTHFDILLAGSTTTTGTPTIMGTTGGREFFIIGENVNIVPGDPGQTNTLGHLIDGGGGDNDQLWLNEGVVVSGISFDGTAPSGGNVHLQNIRLIRLLGATIRGAIDASGIVDTETSVSVDLNSGTVGNITGGSGSNDRFNIGGNIVDGSLTIGLLHGGTDDRSGGNELRIITNAVVRNILFDPNPPTGGDIHLQNFGDMVISGGMVMGNITGRNEGNRFVLQSGMITGNVVGGDGDDIFNLHSAIRIGGFIDGRGQSGGAGDTLQYTGATPETVFGTDFPGRGGLAADPNIGDDTGDVQNIENHENLSGITSLSVRNIERLALSPALNLYGALSDALMQFGQQTAEGFALADLNPQTGRLTQLISKDNPFTKGRIWAHKITHSGNGKGSIGLSLTGLTARAPSDYDYQMNLTQHGFDAPVVSSQWGDFGLRAVSHTMTGTIETNIAEAQVSGYGAGVSLLWRSRELRSLPRHNLTAHVTALAGGYEVDAHTSPSNPQAVVNEVSEGSFSAINAVISAGVADKRELANGLVMRTTADVSWQTLSLDDFTETGENGIIINFDKATRFTARIGAGLEGEHWFSDLAFVHETSSGGTLSSGLSQDYRQHDGTAIEMKFGGKIADLTPGLTIKAFAVWRQSVAGLAGEPSAQFELSYRF